MQCWLILLLILSAPCLYARDNQLHGHASPYLAMHGEDPVKWQEWGEAVQKAAEKEDKMLFVSSGYFSCHWCHVMQRESYSDPEIAHLLNTWFIPVKVDRELNPSLDARLIDFVEQVRGQAGWPLNVFITPEGYPLVGLVYLPPTDFKALLLKIIEKWKADKKDFKKLAQDAVEEMNLATTTTQNHLSGGLKNIDQYRSAFYSQTFGIADVLQGGFGQQNKFPGVPQLTYLLRLSNNVEAKPLRDFLILTLDHMESQGLSDQLAGGYFRYTVDPAWQIPHFEKMLYDNAQLALLYAKAATVLNKPEYKNVAENTLDFMLHELRNKNGSFGASLSAVDNKGVEGGSYLWQQEELKAILDKNEWDIISKHWKVEGPVPLEAGYHLVQLSSLEDIARGKKYTLEQVMRTYDSAKKKMLKVRNSRITPRDDKALASWNALTLKALLAAADNKKYREAAHKLQHYFKTVLWDGKTLQRAIVAGKPLGQAGLEDYAFTADALWDYAQFSHNKKDYQMAYAVILQAWQRFYTPRGWKLKEQQWLKYGKEQHVMADGVLASPSAILIQVTLKAAQYFKNNELAQQVEHPVSILVDDIADAPFWYATHIMAMEDYQSSRN